jgi:hypothetical protein
MNMLKGWIATTFMMVVLTLGAAPANAGIIYGGLADDRSACEDVTKNNSSTDDLGGVIYGGLTGIVSGLTGIIFGGNLTDTQEVQNCGIIYGG